MKTTPNNREGEKMYIKRCFLVKYINPLVTEERMIYILNRTQFSRLQTPWNIFLFEQHPKIRDSFIMYGSTLAMGTVCPLNRYMFVPALCLDPGEKRQMGPGRTFM